MAGKKVVKKKKVSATVEKKPTKKELAAKRAALETADKATKKTKKVTSKKKSMPKKATVKKPRKPSALATGVDFKPGSDMEVAFQTALEGAPTRRAMLDILRDKYGNATTRRGNSKPVSTILNQVVRRALATGDYTLETDWKLVPIKGKAVVTTDKPSKVAKKKSTSVKKTVKKVAKRKKS